MPTQNRLQTVLLLTHCQEPESPRIQGEALGLVKAPKSLLLPDLKKAKTDLGQTQPPILIGETEGLSISHII